MIHRRQFSRRFAEKYGVTYRDAYQICKNVFELLGILLYEEREDVVIDGFGGFKRKKVKPIAIRHPTTREIIVIPERDLVRFLPSELLSEKEKQRWGRGK